MNNKIGIIDYKNGNTQSVINAIEYLGFEIIRCSDKSDLKQATHIILPGVGSFPACMSTLKSINILDELEKSVHIEKKPFLGICVGMQILVEKGYEFLETDGLGWINGKCIKIEFADNNQILPHMGWNQLSEINNMAIINNEDDSQKNYYFVHSYVVEEAENLEGSGYAYYDKKLLACLKKDNIFGVQFHPEKSQENGLGLLNNFCNL